ncbi:MAG: phenylacetate--CoA ligase, partial [Boseongicola sp. SB0677_bin_26]|nr:phenylacetate--CoA ligase [Boseongicola sp. SB0677_bin_26]
PATLTTRAALAGLPVIRKSALAAAQRDFPPFGGYVPQAPSAFGHVFQSPGPIYEPGRVGDDWWRCGRFLHAAGVGRGDIVLNCFSYHLTPAGLIFDSAAAAVGATVIPAGVGQTDLQVRAAADIGATAYSGTPDFLKTILDRADEQDVPLSIAKAVVTGGALFPSLRQTYADRGIACLQNYATADLGNIAYESLAREGFIVDEGVVVEIVRPGTGEPVPDGEVGEVLVTTLNPDYPLVRFATGDLSAVLAGESPCGRTNMRIRGWMGRADQTAKVKGMFVRPEQVAELVAALPGANKARVTVTRSGDSDAMTVQIEGTSIDDTAAADAVRGSLKLRGAVVVVAPGSLPNDGKVIDDLRSYE